MTSGATAWLLVLSGLLVIAAVVLIPAWQSNDELAWRLQVMRRQTLRLDHQKQAYHNFKVALERNEPAAVQQLAFHYLRLKPRGAEAIMLARHRDDDTLMPQFVSVDDMLHVDPPKVGADIRPYQPIGSRLFRYTADHRRYVLLGIAAICLYVGYSIVVRQPSKRGAESAA